MPCEHHLLDVVAEGLSRWEDGEDVTSDED